MKSFLPVICMFFCVHSITAQQLFFPSANYADSASLSKNIPRLASQVIKRYQDEKKFSYFNNLFQIQIVSGDFRNAERSLDSAIKMAGVLIGDTISTKAFGFNFQVYLKEKLNRGNKDKEGGIYATSFEKLYNNLNSAAQEQVPYFFNTNLSDLRSQLKNLISINSKTDSLTVNEALALCRYYGGLLVTEQTQSKGQNILARLEDDKYIHQDSVLIKMPDGGTVSLAIYRDRKITTPQPVVLLYNIYAGREASDCKMAVQNGYVGITANTRGKRLSPDSLEPFEHDAKDAYTIIDWISKQSWCNGKVGMYGGSYLGFAQWAAAKYIHPALKTIVPQAAAAPGIDFPVMNGVFPTYLLRYLHLVMDSKYTSEAEFFNNKKWNDLAGSWYKTGASFRSFDTLEGRPNAIYQRFLQHPSYDHFWQNMIPQKEEYAKIKIPVLITTGYYDDDQLGAMYYYKQLHQWNKNPNDYLLIGPFDHGGSQYQPTKKLGGYTIDSVANISIIGIVFQWMDYVLKGAPRPDMLKDRVNFEVMGANQWRHVPSLAQMHNDSLTFYFGKKIKDSAYTFTNVRPVKEGFIDQKVDMTDRNDIRYRNDDIIAFTKIIYSELNPEKEKIVFISEPVDGTFAISGSLTANIKLKINKKDIDLVLDLYEQTSDGHYFALNESLQRASYANDRTKGQLLQPGKIETIKMENNFVTSKLLQKGSRLVVTVGVNKSPNYQVNYGTGKDVSDETMADGKIPLEIKWLNSSYIRIPILREGF